MENFFTRQNHRIYPDKGGVEYFSQDMGNQRFIWNHFLSLNIAKYETEKKFIFYNEMAGLLPKLKEEFPFLKLGYSAGLQQTLRQLDTALKGSLKSTKNKVRKGFPKFKKFSGTGSVCYPQAVKITNNSLSIPKFKGKIKIVDNGKGLPEDYNSVTMTRSSSGKYHASFVVQTSIPDLVELNSDSRAVGIDMNSGHLVVLDDGSAIVNPRFLAAKEKRLKKYQRQHSRKVKGSSNRNKSRLKLARYHEKVANARLDHVEKFTLDIVRNNDIVVVEDLNVKAMQKWNGRMIGSAPFGMIRSKLEWKCKREGKHFVKIGRYVPTSKACSGCGQIHDMNLSKRWLSCDCGLELHRDHNAAINILNVGLGIINDPTKNLTAGTAGLACGETKVTGRSVQWVSLKQETVRSRPNCSSSYQQRLCAFGYDNAREIGRKAKLVPRM